DKNLNADPERADELEAIFKEGSFEGIAGRIWPKLERIIAAGTGAFSIYTDQMRHYTGDIPHINALYASSEALIGTETDTEGQYQLSTRNAFVEFVPLGASFDTALPAGETEEGREYSLLVTSYAGLYRYKLDDVVKIRGFKDDLPVFTFEGRLSDRINTGYGDVTDGEIYRALCGLSEKTGKRPADYAYLLNEDENSLTVYAETSGESEDNYPATPEESGLLDEILSDISEAYAKAREKGTLKELTLSYVEPESQLLYRDMRRLRKHCSPDQIKPVRNIANPAASGYMKLKSIRG
ncbi:MAG: GH3 auxin-responsive promoter family protein, partial [Lachnospiraceae bacterium]|nr:GH3 auxin-responsive promoter family protein [Lachnospiraceae bacterium]